MKRINANRPHRDTVVLPESDVELQAPSFYHVVLLNDDYTPMDFVINILMHLFHKNQEDAYAIMLEVHHQGRAIAGTYTLEIAEEKASQVIYSAEANEFPLHCVVEAN